MALELFGKLRSMSKPMMPASSLHSRYNYLTKAEIADIDDAIFSDSETELEALGLLGSLESDMVPSTAASRINTSTAARSVPPFSTTQSPQVDGDVSRASHHGATANYGVAETQAMQYKPEMTIERNGLTLPTAGFPYQKSTLIPTAGAIGRQHGFDQTQPQCVTGNFAAGREKIRSIVGCRPQYCPEQLTSRRLPSLTQPSIECGSEYRTSPVCTSGRPFHTDHRLRERQNPVNVAMERSYASGTSMEFTTSGRSSQSNAASFTTQELAALKNYTMPRSCATPTWNTFQPPASYVTAHASHSVEASLGYYSAYPPQPISVSMHSSHGSPYASRTTTPTSHSISQDLSHRWQQPPIRSATHSSATNSASKSQTSAAQCQPEADHMIPDFEQLLLNKEDRLVKYDEDPTRLKSVEDVAKLNDLMRYDLLVQDCSRMIDHGRSPDEITEIMEQILADSRLFETNVASSASTWPHMAAGQGVFRKAPLPDVLDTVSHTTHAADWSTASAADNDYAIQCLQMAAQCRLADCTDAQCCMGQKFMKDMEAMLKDFTISESYLPRRWLYAVAQHAAECDGETRCTVPWCAFFSQLIEESLEERVAALQRLYRSDAILDLDTPNADLILIDENVIWPSLTVGLVPRNGVDFEVTLACIEYGQLRMYTQPYTYPQEHLYISQNMSVDGNEDVWSSLHGLRHENMARYLWTVIDPSQTTTCLDHSQLSGGRLDDMMSSRPQSTLSLGEVQMYFLGLLSALTYLHEHGIYYLLWTPSSISLNEQRTVARLADFSCAVTKAAIGRSVENVGQVLLALPPHILPPEIFEGQLDRYTDMWSVGCLLYRVLCGRCVHHELRHCPPDELRNKMKTCDPADMLSAVCDSYIRRLLSPVFQPYRKRATVAQLSDMLRTLRVE